LEYSEIKIRGDNEAVLPGALAPALIDDDGPNGAFFSAIDHNLGS